MQLQSRTYDLEVNAQRQIKVQSIDKPVRFEVKSGTFEYEVFLNTEVIVTSTVIASGVITAPAGAWGSEIRITCTGAGVLHVAYEG
jgi:hypothetical protein